MLAFPLGFISVFTSKDMKLHAYKFILFCIIWNVCHKIGFSGNGDKTEFPGNENSWFSHEKSSPKWKGRASYFTKAMHQ